jgi:hypothetical protein
MSKKKKQKTTDQQAIKQKISIQDDPYWKISRIYVDAHRVGRFLSVFDQFEYKHPEWTDDLIEGIPTYYCVLGVEKGATKDQIKQAFEKKRQFSSYPDDVVEESFDVLSNPRLKKEYDKLLFVFEQITKCMPPHEKKELIKKHSAYINDEKEYVRMEQILQNYKWLHTFYMKGMPDFYEIVGVAQDASFDEIKNVAQHDSELIKKIFTILGNQASREDYDFTIYFTNKYAEKKHLEEREKHKKKWEQIDKTMFEKIMLIVLSEPDAIGKYMGRWSGILNNNQDWKQYLPPNKETFLSVLGVEKNSLSDDKKEIERTLREKYRDLEKTVEVNLSYTVLKNMSKRDDYLWLLENHEIFRTIEDLFAEEKAALDRMRSEAHTKPDFDEFMDMVQSFLEQEEKRMKTKER